MATINSKIKEFSSVGDRPVRHDGYDKVQARLCTGQMYCCLDYFTEKFFEVLMLMPG